MVEILGIIVVADGVRKLSVNEVLRRFAVAIFQRSHEWAAVGFFHSLLKPVGNGVFIYRCNLNVRNLHFQPEIVADRPLSDFLQVAREKQEVPKVILRLMNIAVGDVLVYLLFYRSACH